MPLVYCDKEKIILAIQGLIENSVKYTPDYGRIEVSLSVLKKFLRVSIRDNGMGIPKNDQDKLFTKLYSLLYLTSSTSIKLLAKSKLHILYM